MSIYVFIYIFLTNPIHIYIYICIHIEQFIFYRIISGRIFHSVWKNKDIFSVWFHKHATVVHEKNNFVKIILKSIQALSDILQGELSREIAYVDPGRLLGLCVDMPVCFIFYVQYIIDVFLENKGYTVNYTKIHFINIKKNYQNILYHFTISAMVVQLSTINNKTTIFCFYNFPIFSGDTGRGWRAKTIKFDTNYFYTIVEIIGGTCVKNVIVISILL